MTIAQTMDTNRTLITLEVGGDPIPTIVPRINGSLVTPAEGRPSTALIVLHPTSNTLDHYLLAPLARRGFAALGLNGRFVNNQAAVRAEHLLRDVDAGVRFLREQGFERVVLLGNSLGGSLMCLYQSQAEAPGATPNRFGERVDPDLRLAPADALVITVAPVGPGHVMAHFLDPAVVDENDPRLTEPVLDMFNPANGPPYDAAWLTRYRAAQLERNRRLTERCRAALRSGFSDLAFVVHRTAADPRFLDVTLDPSDRPPGAGWGDAATLNVAGLFFGRHTTARTWLSLWSYDATHLDGPRHLAATSIPALFIVHSADQICFAGDQAPYFDAFGRDRLPRVVIQGAGHVLVEQPEKAAESARAIAAWLAGTPVGAAAPASS